MPEKLDDYLAREAGEYLDGIERLLDRGDGANTSELVRLARGVRGSARMAGSEAVARAAEQLESMARSSAERPGSWSMDATRGALAIVGELRVLLGAMPIEHLFHDDEGPHILSRPDAKVAPPVIPAEIAASSVIPGQAAASSVIPAEAGIQNAADAVPIERLLLKGDAAIRAASALHPELDRAIREGSASAPALLAELFDLLELARSG